MMPEIINRMSVLIVSICFVLFADMSVANDTGVFLHPAASNHVTFQKKIKKLAIKSSVVKQFVQKKKVAALTKPLVSKGNMVLSTKGICLVTTSPFSSTIKVNKQGIYQQLGNQKATFKSAKKSVDARQMAKIMLGLFTLDIQKLATDFEVYFVEKRGTFEIGLKPKGTILKKMIDRIVVKGSDEIKQINIQEKNGDTTELVFSPYTQNEKLTLENCGT